MRQWYLALSQSEHAMVRAIKRMMADGYEIGQAAFYSAISVQRATQLLARAKVKPSELRERRKDYIVRKLTSSVSHRHTPYVIACYFGVEEPYVLSLIRELREEGRLPPATHGDKVWQEDILKVLRCEYPNVFRAATVGKKKLVGDKVYVAGKGWLTWKEAEELAKSLAK